ncbi:MAG TPA: hypothetical protein VF834_06430 [Streptosporangiaceae bacterium]
MTFDETKLISHDAGRSGRQDHAGADPARSGDPAAPGLGDFDFFVGSWDSRQRRLREPLAGCDEWDEFAATTRCWSVFGGAANVDELSVPDRGFSGLTVRLLDPATGDWSLYWANSRDGALALPPVSGRFTDGVGRFYSREDYQGRQITVRYTWSDITPSSARREQAFSADDGQTWETNWVAEFTRRET